MKLVLLAPFALVAALAAIASTQEGLLVAKSSKPAGAAVLASEAIKDPALPPKDSAGDSSSGPLVLELDLAGAVLLERAGLYPESMCAAGLLPQTAAAVIALSKDQADGSTALADADIAYATARPEVDRLRRLIQGGKGSDEDVAAYGAANLALTQAEADRKAALDAAFAAATAGLTQEQRATLSTIRTNQSWQLPCSYLTAERSEADWVKLRDALDAQKVSVADGEQLDAPIATWLADMEADGAVAAALAGVDSHLAELQAAWDAALDED